MNGEEIVATPEHPFYVSNQGGYMYLFKWIKFKNEFRKQCRNPLDDSVLKLAEKTLLLFPKTVDISDGELRGDNGFWSENLSHVWHSAEKSNTDNDEDVDFMIWAIYRILHRKSRLNFKAGETIVNISELPLDEIGFEYIKSCLKAEIY